MISDDLLRRDQSELFDWQVRYLDIHPFYVCAVVCPTLRIEAGLEKT